MGEGESALRRVFEITLVLAVVGLERPKRSRTPARIVLRSEAAQQVWNTAVHRLPVVQRAVLIKAAREGFDRNQAGTHPAPGLPSTRRVEFAFAWTERLCQPSVRCPLAVAQQNPALVWQAWRPQSVRPRGGEGEEQGSQAHGMVF